MCMLSSLRTRKYRSLRQISKSPVSNPKLANYPLWCCTMNSMESLAIIRLAQLVSGSFHYYLSSFHCCEDRFHIHVFNSSSNIWLPYVHNRWFTTSWVYLEPTQWPAPSWLVSSVGRALHRYRKGHGFKSRTCLNIFQAFFSLLLK